MRDNFFFFLYLNVHVMCTRVLMRRMCVHYYGLCIEYSKKKERENKEMKQNKVMKSKRRIGTTRKSMRKAKKKGIRQKDRKQNATTK